MERDAGATAGPGFGSAADNLRSVLNTGEVAYSDTGYSDTV